MVVSSTKEKPKSLKGRMSCGDSDCDAGLHCFRVGKRKAKEIKPEGACQSCGIISVIDWHRVRTRDLEDVANTIEALKNELIRHKYWCVIDIDPQAIVHIRKKGRLKMREVTKKRIEQSVGKAKNFHEGYQTPWEGGRVVYYAQHATGTCCRCCIEYWHGIEQGRDLTADEVGYLAFLLEYYIEQKIQLTENGETVKDIYSKNPELFTKRNNG